MKSMRQASRVRRGVTALITVLSVLIAIPAAARTNTRSKPIFFVHGIDWAGYSGTDCNKWAPMISALRSWGWTGGMATVAYYAFDRNCTSSLDHHGNHSRHYGGTSEHDVNNLSSHGFDTRIEHIAYHLAWQIWDHDSRSGIVVDAVGHSMGGLILRYALAQTQRRHPDFPPYLLVEDIVTLGTPHAGSWYASGCSWADQCDQMVPGSSFLSWLGSYAQNPQGSGGSDWTVVGSYSDEVVSASSANAMDASHKVRYLTSSSVRHGDYLIDTSNTRTADVKYYDRGGTWRYWYDAPYAVRWTDLALYSTVF